MSSGIPSDVGKTTQLSNAWRLRLSHAEDLRYIVGVGWIAWNGKRWFADDALATQMCESVTRKLYAEAEAAVDACSETQKRICSDKDSTATMKEMAKEALSIAKARLAHAKSSQSVGSFRDMLAHAGTFPEMRITADAVDSKPSLLACANGTLDLNTGTLRETLKSDLITRQSPVEYDPSVETDGWTAFLMDALGDEESVEYLRQFAGYCLRGEASQELFLFVHGPPGNGKSTFIESLCSCLGEELSITIDFETLCRKSTSSQKYDTARMRGVRMVRTSESDRNQRLDEGLVCRWAGGERVRGRALYEDPFDFMPQFKLAMSVNGKPRINPDQSETGIWRRMVCVPFVRPTIEESLVDSGIKRYWTNHKEGGKIVLKWAATGSADYASAGRLPKMPDLLRAARERYREECDIVHQFMREHAVEDRKGFIPCEALRQAFTQWSTEQGEQYPLNAQQFASRIMGDPWKAYKKRERVNGSNINVWKGVRWLTRDECVGEEPSCSPPTCSLPDRGPEDDDAEREERAGIQENGS